ncbi:Hint domain-containing protein [Loktanella fryxellensis]|uniref:Hint domain-containing protein n=1 Tax=Loktanella fryxellensis TaxID=245187 RepID=A0A1H8BHB2_9RHOB|nr:Hint domain-containing protein [Loktanella fryxellensis]SEM82255.1 Hint domain-containing protein [Loktanella fryxellensis]
MQAPAPPSQSVHVLPAELFTVTDGVAFGDPLTFADDLVLDDTYELVSDAAPLALALTAAAAGGQFRIAAGGQVGMAGNDLFLDCCITLMAPDGKTCEALVLVEVIGGGVEAVYLLPLAHLLAHHPYRLVGVDRQIATTRFAQVASVSFTRGTHITMASGAQVPIEAIRIGDRVLTRDDGPQAVRWVGETTLRATGDFAPVVIAKGALHNANDLVLSPDHRLFVYQRQDRLGAGRHEVLVKVRHLINGDTVFQQDGGFVDYFQLLFDQHQIIYAEGIAAESLLIDPRTRAALPAHLHDDLHRGHGHRHHHDYEVRESLLSAGDAVALLRRASTD